jgi:hypothetical protein
MAAESFHNIFDRNKWIFEDNTTKQTSNILSSQANMQISNSLNPWANSLNPWANSLNPWAISLNPQAISLNPQANTQISNSLSLNPWANSLNPWANTQISSGKKHQEKNRDLWNNWPMFDILFNYIIDNINNKGKVSWKKWNPKFYKVDAAKAKCKYSEIIVCLINNNKGNLLLLRALLSCYLNKASVSVDLQKQFREKLRTFYRIKNKRKKWTIDNLKNLMLSAWNEKERKFNTEIDEQRWRSDTGFTLQEAQEVLHTISSFINSNEPTSILQHSNNWLACIKNDAALTEACQIIHGHLLFPSPVVLAKSDRLSVLSWLLNELRK